MNKITLIMSKLLLSAALITLGVVLMRHGSSFGLELGIGLILMSAFHFVLWKDIESK